MKKSLYATVLKIIYLVINLLKTLNYFKIALMPKRWYPIIERRNNCSFPVLCKSRYLVYLHKHLRKVNSYKKDNNTKGNTQEDTVWGGI